MNSISLFVQTPLFLKLSAPGLVVLLIGIFWWRAGSIHSVFDRLWRLVAGKTDVQDPKLKEFIQQNRDLEKFRFIYGIKIETRSDLHLLLAWINENSINIVRLQQIKRWIDMRSPNIVTTPPRGFFIRNGITTLISILIVITASTVISTQIAWLQMKESKIWFWTDGNSVHQAFDKWTIDAVTCKNDIIKTQKSTGFNRVETIAICDALEKNALNDIFRKTVKEQQVLGVVIGIISFLLLMFSIFALNSADEARRIFNRLTKTKESPPLADPPSKPRASINKPRRRKIDNQSIESSTKEMETEPPKEG